ncbi:ABC transporter ATP-binding protein [Pseudoponticoccus marisrubri]|uniref:Methionine ABC transporter ATP-binding protein n=1 Tax=Pseudoponticoccus marisrubri TaxID=1685382 RepID=A0A0W7WEX9_9RHOB|nr:ABC transporter ATP-binding protein [Pseudoponticoccus marisrubri]KUF09133.1 methionine ABC transporter ATP-binding protein [Pseudoponticoccus marisrubri]
MREMHPSQTTDATPAPLLEVRDLRVSFDTPHGLVKAVGGVSWTLSPGETLGIIGESGSGKSVGLEAIMGLIKSPPGHVAGQVLFEGEDVLTMKESRRRQLRGEKIAMIFQDAMSALNPALTVGTQIAEVYRLRRRCSQTEAERKAVELMDRVKIPSAKSRVRCYPHEFSGGMCQRVMIATALALNPLILIADEPTTALDVTVQRQIMTLLADLQREDGMALVLITHDLGLVAETVDRAMVMYAGRVVESAPVSALFDAPSHPYTRGLIRSMPRIDGASGALHAIGGTPPAAGRMPRGCAFHPRCTHRIDRCRAERPALRPVAPRHTAACHLVEEMTHD